MECLTEVKLIIINSDRGKSNIISVGGEGMDVLKQQKYSGVQYFIVHQG